VNSGSKIRLYANQKAAQVEADQLYKQATDRARLSQRARQLLCAITHSPVDGRSVG